MPEAGVFPGQSRWTLRGLNKDVFVAEQLTLSVVDQSPVRDGGSAGDALRDTIELAAVVEKLGYQRYWLAEHHSIANFAGTSPEVLIGQVAARTNTIRVGSGGVMLSHYSAFKVAENFRMLEALYPGRIDLGIGRAPGSDQLTNAANSMVSRSASPAESPSLTGDWSTTLKISCSTTRKSFSRALRGLMDRSSLGPAFGILP